MIKIGFGKLSKALAKDAGYKPKGHIVKRIHIKKVRRSLSNIFPIYENQNTEKD